MAANKETPVEIIETEKKRAQGFRDRLNRVRTLLERERQDLVAEATATELEFGSSDLSFLRAKFQQTSSSNESIATQVREAHNSLERELQEVERQAQL